MLLAAELIFILVLIFVLIILITEEAKIKRSKVTSGAVKEYWDGRERRKSMRIDTSLFVRYSLKKKHHIRNGQMKDISSGGMRLILNEKFVEGTLLLLEFDLPNTKATIGIKGKVVWSSGKFNERDELGRRLFQTGIQFVNIKSEDNNRLINYITKIAENP